MGSWGALSKGQTLGRGLKGEGQDSGGDDGQKVGRCKGRRRDPWCEVRNFRSPFWLEWREG